MENELFVSSLHLFSKYIILPKYNALIFKCMDTLEIISALVNLNVLKIESNRSVRSSIDHKIGLVQCKKSVVNEPDENRSNWR